MTESTLPLEHPDAVVAIEGLHASISEVCPWREFERVPCGTAPRRRFGRLRRYWSSRTLGHHRYLLDSSDFAVALSGLRHRAGLRAENLFRFACLGQAVEPTELEGIPRSVLDACEAADVMRREDGRTRLRVRFVPYNGHAYLADPLDGPFAPAREGRAPAYVGFLTHQQLAFLRPRLPGKPSGALLEMGCGVGMLALDIAGGFDTVVGSEIYDRSLAYARVNARLNRVSNITLVASDLFQSVDGTFDLIVFNPWQPTEGSLDLVGAFLAEIPGRLRPGGRLVLVVTSAMKQQREPVMTFLEARLTEHDLHGKRWIIESWLDRAASTVNTLNFMEISLGARSPSLTASHDAAALAWHTKAAVARLLW